MEDEIKFFRFRQIRLAICEIVPSDAGRRLREKESVSCLTRFLLGPDITIDHSPDGKPFVSASPDFQSPEISISHSRNYAAVAIAPPHCRTGIDIEDTDRLSQFSRLASRVLNDKEIEKYSSAPDGLLKAWTLKEAAFKASHLHPVDFLHDIFLPEAASDIIHIHKKSAEESLKIFYSGEVLPGLILSVVSSHF